MAAPWPKGLELLLLLFPNGLLEFCTAPKGAAVACPNGVEGVPELEVPKPVLGFVPNVALLAEALLAPKIPDAGAPKAEVVAF